MQNREEVDIIGVGNNIGNTNIIVLGFLISFFSIYRYRVGDE